MSARISATVRMPLRRRLNDELLNDNELAMDVETFAELLFDHADRKHVKVTPAERGIILSIVSEWVNEHLAVPVPAVGTHVHVVRDDASERWDFGEGGVVTKTYATDDKYDIEVTFPDRDDWSERVYLFTRWEVLVCDHMKKPKDDRRTGLLEAQVRACLANARRPMAAADVQTMLARHGFVPQDGDPTITEVLITLTDEGVIELLSNGLYTYHYPTTK